MREYEHYQNVNNWDFSKINCEKEELTNWNMYEILKKHTTKNSKILDLGTAGGEKVLKYYPEVDEIIATDYSEEMIKTANKNLTASNRKNIEFRMMDNLKMTVSKNYFDIVTARHTPTDPKQIYQVLKKGGLLIIRGVDKLDCFSLKKEFGKGQGFKDKEPISLIDYVSVLESGFRSVELVPIHVREYYKTKEDLLALLYKTPIISDFSEIEENNITEFEIDINKLDKYIKENTYKKGILLIRRYYGITAIK